MSLDQLRTNRDEIVWWEICSLLHDIGKLSDDFLNYRRDWHWKDAEWKLDPHDHGWFVENKKADEPVNDKILFSEFKNLAKFFQSPLPGTSMSVAGAVNEHIKPKVDDEQNNLLKIGDGTDSRYDRNNPLPGNEQTDHKKVRSAAKEGDIRPDMFRGNVFGYEGEKMRVVTGELEAKRRELYRELEKLFCNGPVTMNAGVYWYLLNLFRNSFERAMSDTTRPCNDTSLYEHVYSVASITKALLIKKRLQPTFDPKAKPNELFLLWGFGFDSLRFLSYSHKIGDLIGRKNVLNRIYQKAIEKMQYDTPLGNCVYRDDNCVFFLTADLPEMLDLMEQEIVKVASGKSDGEIVPAFARTTKNVGTNDLTGIAGLIVELRKKMAIPVTAHSELIAEKVRAIWVRDGASICPVCRMRPINDEANKVCSLCLERRERNKPFVQSQPAPQTPYLSEIADRHGRAALIIAKFGLHDWLNGKMIRTTLITEPHGAKHMVDVLKEFKMPAINTKADRLKNRALKKYEEMKQEFLECRANMEAFDKAGFLFSRHFSTELKQFEEAKTVWNEIASSSEDDLFNAVCAKTPTPSSVLDVWETSKEFLEREGNLNRDGCPRTFIKVSGSCNFPEGRAFDGATIGGEHVDAVYEDKNIFWILGTPHREDWRGKKLVLKTPPGEYEILEAASRKNAFRPFRLITATPDLLLLLVPASEAIKVTTAMYNNYLEEFGKVYGRLPFSIGNIFFPQHLPMFSVLDAARRMEHNFSHLHGKPQLVGKLPAGVKEKAKLGDGNVDWYHPYIRTKEKHPDAVGYFQTPIGPVVQFTADPDDALLQPNYYDFEWLGSSAQRLAIHVDTPPDADCSAEELLSKLLRKRGDGGLILLDDLDARIVSLWESLRNSRISTSRLRNLEQVLERKHHAWQTGEPASDKAAVNQLGDSLVRHYFSGPIAETVRTALHDGFLQKTLSLYLHILKENLETTHAV